MISPIKDNFLVKQDKSPSMYGSLHIPDTAVMTLSQGEVIARGPGNMLDTGVRAELPFEVGDTVIFSPKVGHRIDDDLLILNEAFVIAFRKEKRDDQ